MNMKPLLSLACAMLLVTGCSEAPQESVGAAPRQLEWDDLMPADFDPTGALPDVDIGALSDDDPRTQRFYELVREAWNNAPVVPELDGTLVRLPGFVVPLEYDEKQVSEFLLVPYFGACIHTPPPPANQIVHVTTGGFGPSPEQLLDPVWVTGTLRTETVASELAHAGYRMDATVIEPYEEPAESAAN